jgi:iron-sulfur cluster repair protein YtfE (RIC family)
MKTEPTMPATVAKNACDLLDADHLAVKHLFVEYARLAYSLSASGEDRVAIARKICGELTVHAQIEEEIFYPALEKAVPEAADVVAEGRSEHQDAKDLIARIEGMQGLDQELDDTVAELARRVEHHVKEERDELFPKARAAKGLDLDMLGEQMRQRQQALMGGSAAEKM